MEPTNSRFHLYLNVVGQLINKFAIMLCPCIHAPPPNFNNLPTPVGEGGEANVHVNRRGKFPLCYSYSFYSFSPWDIIIW